MQTSIFCPMGAQVSLAVGAHDPAQAQSPPAT